MIALRVRAFGMTETPQEVKTEVDEYAEGLEGTWML